MPTLITALQASLLLLHPGAQPDSCATDRLVDVPRQASSRLVVPPPGEPGTPLRVTGRVLLADGTPVPGVMIYVYQTNANGIYPKRPGLCGAARIQGYLRGYVQSDVQGRYEILTIRPGIYRERDTPAHIHMTVALTRPVDAQHMTYIDDLMFEDDPILDARWRARLDARGGSGIVRVSPRRSANGDTLQVTRDIRWDLVPGAALPNTHPPTQR